MSGHSRWANIKHKKGAADARKGKVFSKIAKEIMVAVRQSGSDPSGNLTLRALIQKAKSVNMPGENVDRAIKRGAGEASGMIIEEVVYEGYAPGGVAVLVQVLTDNRNRTAAEVRHVFTRHGANMTGGGSVSRFFSRKGNISVKAEGVDEDSLLALVLDAGAEDMSREGDVFDIVTDPSGFMTVVEALEKGGFAIERSEVTMMPSDTVPVTDKAKAGSVLRFVEELEELDDVQNVYSNFDISDSLLEEVQSA